MNKNILLSIDFEGIKLILTFLFYTFWCSVAALVIIGVTQLYKYFSKTESLDIEGDILNVTKEEVPVYLPNTNSVDGFVSPSALNGPYVFHEYKVEIATKAGTKIINLTMDLFHIISKNVASAQMHIKLHCERILWIDQINAKSILGDA